MKEGNRGKNVSFIISIVVVIAISSVILSLQNNPFENDITDGQFRIEEFSDTYLDKNLKSSADDPNGKPLLVTQYANISKTFSNVESNENVTFPLAPGWISKNATIHFEGVERKKQWNTNDHFTSNDDSWDFAIKDTDGLFWDGGYVDWDIGGHVGTNYFGMGPGDPVEGDYVGFQQNYTISSEALSSNLAIASFDYYYDVKGSYPNASMYLEISIGGVEKNVSRKLDDITMNQWETISVQYNPKTFGQTLPGDISVFAGVYMHKDTTHFQTDEVYLDNIKLTLWTDLNNTPGLVKTYDVLTDTNYQYYNTSIGNGYSFIDVERNSPGDITFTIFENISDKVDFLEFNIASVTIVSPSLKIFNSTYSGSDGSFYTSGFPINWKTSFSVSLPTYYNSWIEIQKPLDWSIISILDGFDTEQIGGCVGNEYGSSKLIIPNNIVGEGIWDIEAESQNQITNINVLVWNNTQFENQLKLTNNDIFKINLALNDTISLTNSELNCTIFFPNGTIFLHESLEPSSYNLNFSSYMIGKNMTIGQYSVEVIWRNKLTTQELDQVGFAEQKFSLWHHTNLSAITPYYEIVAGDPLLLKLSYFDIDLDADIDFADVTFTSSYGHSGTMAYQGLGLYFIDLDTSLLGLGDYYFSFNASKSFYENQSITDSIHLKIVTQPIALEFPSRVINSTGNSYAICKVNVVGEISGTPIWPANISSDWSNSYSIFNHNNGTYIFNFSTYGLPTEGVLDTFEIEIFANKSSYGTTSDFITLIIHPISALANANDTHIETYINEYFEIKVNHTVEDTDVLINGGECTVLWYSNFNVSQVSDGFIIRYFTSGLSIDVYSSLVTLSKSGYEDALVSITIVIQDHDVNMTVNINGGEVFQNSLFELYFKESVNISTQVFAIREEIFLTGSSITLLSDSFQANLTELMPTFYSTIVNIDGEYFVSGLNTIFLRFELINYTTTVFSFQFFIRAQNVNLNISIDNQNIPENYLIETSFNDFFYISCKAFAEAEGIYLSGGTVKFVLNIHEFNLTESFDFWYNESLSISTHIFSLGINYAYVKFELANYTTTTFSFQILVNQIEMNVQAVDFVDSISAIAGDTLTIFINITENGSNIPIKNATIYCYWEFGTYYFVNTEQGLYYLELELSSTIIGTHRLNLVISTEEYIYKTTEDSFLIVVAEPDLPDYVGWIVVIGLIIIIGILGSLSLRSYVLLPKKRKRNLIITDKVQPYKDIRNIQAVLVSNRYSGIALYNKTFSILDENYLSGFSGFIQAITILGKQYTKNGVKVVDIESRPEDIDEQEKEIKELDFNFFHSLICDFGELRIVLLLSNRSSERLRIKIDVLTKEIYTQIKDLLTSFDGSILTLHQSIEESLYRHLSLHYKDPFELNKSKHYHSVKVSGNLTNLEIRILNVLESQSKYRKSYLLEDIINFIEDVNEDERIIALESLVMQKMIKPEEK